MKPTIEEKINKIIETENPDLAIQKINGYLKLFYWNQNILNSLAELYYQRGNASKAGQYWFFKENKSESEQMAVESFQRSFGNDLKLIARKLIGHGFKSPKNLDTYTKSELLRMLDAVQEKEGGIPDFAKNWYAHLKKI